jgi:hypothetical protein
MRLSDPGLQKSISSAIKFIRNRYNSSNTRDALKIKAKMYPKSGDWARAKIQELEKVIYDINKSVPATDHGEWRSIEFELIFNTEAAIQEFVREVRAKGYAKLVTIKGDGSIRIDEDDKRGAVAKEVVVSYRTGHEVIVRDVCAAFKGRAYVNNSCGTHVHFDMRNVVEADASRSGKRLARCVPALRKLLPKSRRESKYCLTSINDFHGSNESRYSFVNMQAYSKYKTIEVRGHSGTLNANKILNWIALCEKIMTMRIRTREGEITNPLDFIKIYHLDEVLADYVKTRYSTYNVVDTSAIPAPVNAPVAPPILDQMLGLDI